MDLIILKSRLWTVFWLMSLPACVLAVLYFHFSGQAAEGIRSDAMANAMAIWFVVVSGLAAGILLTCLGIGHCQRHKLLMFKERKQTRVDARYSAKDAVSRGEPDDFSFPWGIVLLSLMVIAGGIVLTLFLTSRERMDPFQLVEEGSYAAIIEMLDNRPDAVNAGSQGQTLLMQAVESGRLEIARLLLDRGADLERKDAKGQTALFKAIGQPELVDILLNAGADPNLVDRQGKTAVHVAIDAGSIESIRLLAGYNVKLNRIDQHGDTPLTAAIEKQLDVVELLLSRGADVDYVNGLGETPLHVASRVGNKKAVRLLVLAGAGMKTESRQGWTPLHLAAIHGNVRVARELLQEGVDIDLRNRRRQTPLMCAVHENNIAMVDFLLDEEADVAVADLRGNTPLHEALLTENYDVAERLLVEGANPDAVNDAGITPRRLIVMSGLEQRFESLLSKL